MIKQTNAQKSRFSVENTTDEIYTLKFVFIVDKIVKISSRNDKIYKSKKFYTNLERYYAIEIIYCCLSDTIEQIKAFWLLFFLVPRFVMVFFSMNESEYFVYLPS